MKINRIRQKKGGYDIIVVDDYLPETAFKNVNSHINDFSYPRWQLQKTLVQDAKWEKQFQFMFRMVEYKREEFVDAAYLPRIVMSAYDKQMKQDSNLQVVVHRARANCFVRHSTFPRSMFTRHMGWHSDMNDDRVSTLLLYLEDSNGGTQFKDNGRKVMSKRNRAIIFPSKIEHQTVMQTNTLFRMNININFFLHPIGVPL